METDDRRPRRGRPPRNPDAPKRKKPARRKPGEGSWRELANGTVRYRVPVGSSAIGMVTLKDFYGRTKAEALEKYGAYVAAHPDGPPPADQRQTLNDLLATWIDAGDFARSTREDRKALIKNHVATTIGKTAIGELRTADLEQWLRAKRDEGMGGRTCEKAHSIIRAALSQAVAWGILERNVAMGAKAPSYPRRTAKALTVDQVRALLSAAAGELDLRKPYPTKRTPKGGAGRKYPPIDPRLYTLYLLYVVVGPRRGEPLALRWSDFDAQAGTLEIARSIDNRRREGGVKTAASERTIYLDDHMVQALKEHRTLMQAEGHQEGWKPDGLIFPSGDGTILGTRNLHRHFKMVLAAAGLPADTRLHDLRHSAASIMLAEGGQLVDVSRTLGHSSSIITAKIYAHAYEEGQRKAVSGASQRLRRPKPGSK